MKRIHKERGPRSEARLAWRWWVVVGCLLVGIGSPARAQKKVVSWGEVAGDMGIGVLGSDVYTTFQLGADIREGDVSAGLQAALRLRTVDVKEKGGKTLRREDWDEPSDFAHIIRYLTYGKRLQSVTFGLSLGELCPAGIGNGTLFDNYHSVVDLDHPHSGLQARLRHRYFGVDFVMDDFVRPRVMGIRLEAKPFPFLKRLSLGLSGVADLKAPRVARVDEEGRRRVSPTKRLLVDSEFLGFVGYDVSYLFGSKKRFWVKPYVDNNWAVNHGGGLHAGLTVGGRLMGGKLELMGKAEYRLGWGGYSPEYVDLFYDVQRYQVPLGQSWSERGGGRLDTKLTSLDLHPPLSHGGKWAIRLAYDKVFWLKGAYALREGPLGDSAFFEMGLPFGRKWVFSALVAKTGLFGKDSFGSADGLLAAAEAKLEVFRYLYVLGQFRYLYALDEEGLFRGVLVANLAVGGRWGY